MYWKLHNISLVILLILLANEVFSFTDMILSHGTPWYIVASISAAAVVVVVIVMAGGICFLRVRRKDRQRNKERVISQVEMKPREDLIPQNNSAHPV